MSCAFAQEEGHLRFLKYQSDYRVNPDAIYTVVRRLSIERAAVACQPASMLWQSRSPHASSATCRPKSFIKPMNEQTVSVSIAQTQ